MTPIRALLLAAPLSLAACSFGPKVPPTLMVMTPAAMAPAGSQRSVAQGQAIAISWPTTPAALANVRVPVQQGPTAIAYLKDAQWSEPPARLFRNLLAETVTARTGRVVLDQRQPVVASGQRLTGRLLAFGVDEPTSSAVVIYDATLVRDGTEGAQLRRFEARIPVAKIDAATVAPALNQAANQVAGEVAGWIGG